MTKHGSFWALIYSSGLKQHCGSNGPHAAKKCKDKDFCWGSNGGFKWRVVSVFIKYSVYRSGLLETACTASKDELFESTPTVRVIVIKPVVFTEPLNGLHETCRDDLCWILALWEPILEPLLPSARGTWKPYRYCQQENLGGCWKCSSFSGKVKLKKMG